MKVHSFTFLSLCIGSAVALKDNSSTGLLSTGDGMFPQPFMHWNLPY